MSRLGLALSGGGLRATLFHLGVVRFMRDAGILRDVTYVVSVSGGSILGAHLTLNWDRYTGSETEFAEAAADIIRFVRSDARNQIARRIPFLVPLRLFQRMLFRGHSRVFTPTGLLERLYARHLFGDTRVHQLPETPELHLLTTNVSEGSLCSFTRNGLIIQRRGKGATTFELLPARLSPISLAVAASSAFPGFFPPALITADELGLPEGTFPAQTFTDGGVYDNLGVRAFDLLGDIAPPLDAILVSDAGKSFCIVRPKPLGMISQAMRATDILWDRVGVLEKQNFEADPRFLFIPATDFVDPKDDPTALHPVIQTEVANIRTDMDRFSPLEISSLVQQGYCVARKQCRTRPDLFESPLTDAAPWDPMTVADALPGDQAAVPTSQQAGSARATLRVTEQAQTLRRSASRRVWSTLLDFRDWPTYIYVPLLILLLGVVPVHVWRYRRQANTNAMIVDAIAHGSPDFRKILELVQRDATPTWTPQECEVRSEASELDNRGFEFVRDTHILNLRDWRSKTRDVASFSRRILVRKLATDNRLVIHHIRPHDRIDFRCGPETLKPVVRRITPKTGERDTIWELEFDFSSVRTGSVQDIEFEAIVHDVEAHWRKGETWWRYRPAYTTAEVSIWLLFPEHHPYQEYNLIRYPIDNPSTFQKVDTLYTIDHPRGSIIAWSLINPEVGHIYECEWAFD